METPGATLTGDAQRYHSELRDRGFTVIPVIPPSEIRAVHDSVLGSVQAAPTTPDALERGVLHLPALLNYDQSLAPYLASSPLLDVIEAHLGPGARITFTTSQTNFTPPGGVSRGEWHADWPYNQSNMQRVAAPYPPGPDHSFGITTLWMLSPFTEETGGTVRTTLCPPPSRAVCKFSLTQSRISFACSSWSRSATSSHGTPPCPSACPNTSRIRRSTR